MKNKDSLTLSFQAQENIVGQRIDKALCQISEIGTRSRAEALISKGAVTLNGKSVKSSYIVKANDLFSILLPTPVPSELQPMEYPLDILFEDRDIIVINKPAGLVVHPAAGHAQDTLVNALIYHTNELSMKYGEGRPGIVHRLDKDTSGVLVIAKNDHSHQNLSEQFKTRSVHRIYLALIHGVPAIPKANIQSQLARHPTDRKKFASLKGARSPDQGKWASTNYEIVQRLDGDLCYLRLKLDTGRTHQIRVHLSERGHPIVGDTLYGADKKVKNIRSDARKKIVSDFPRFALHASELAFIHPTTGQRMSFSTEWPNDLKPLLFNLGIKGSL